MQFSDSPSAANGGNLGWVNKGKLASPLETALNKMSSGDISEPILVGDGYYILKLQKPSTPKKTNRNCPTKTNPCLFGKSKNGSPFQKAFAGTSPKSRN